MAAPAELRTPHMHRANDSLLESADGSMATVATRREKNFSLRQRTKTHYEPKISLTPTGLLMEGHSAHRGLEAVPTEVSERNGDISTVARLEMAGNLDLDCRTAKPVASPREFVFARFTEILASR